MAKWDVEYLKLCKKILTEGVEVENRTGVNTIKIPMHHFEFDLEEEFPVLTTKQMFFKNAITEILWIYQAQSNDVRWLAERNNKVWNEWMIDSDGVYRTYEVDGDADASKKVVLKNLEGRVMLDAYGDPIMVGAKDDSLNYHGTSIKDAKYFGEEYANTIGTAYGYIVRRYQLTQKLLEKLKNHQTDRRMVMSLWQDEYLKTAVLPSCVWSSEWDVTNGKLNAWVHQRSCDVPLGLPFNITQYSVLLYLLAHCTGLEPGKLYWSIKDAHIYNNQIDGIKLQIKRGEELPDLKAPELWINPEKRDFFEIDNSRELKDIKVRKYEHYGKISFPIVQ